MRVRQHRWNDLTDRVALLKEIEIGWTNVEPLWLEGLERFSLRFDGNEVCVTQ